MMEFKDVLFDEALTIEDEIRGIRRRIHSLPEPGYEEHETARLITERLNGLGIETWTSVAGTGVLGLLNGIASGKALLLRADMDALRKEEAVDASERPYRSTRPGMMHACGHDGHVAVLLGAAEILSRLRHRFAGTVKLAFQPAEEGGKGGLRMVEEGVLDAPPVSAAFALHAWPDLPCGVIGCQHGTSMAASSDFVVEIRGRSGHAAFPHTCVDPVPAAAQIVTALQTIRSREVSPLTGSVVSVTVLETGSKTRPDAGPGEDPLLPSQTNVIPQIVRLRGTSRAFTVDGQAMQLERISEIASDVARAFRTQASFAVGKEYPPTIHDREMTDFGARVAGKLLGPENVAWAQEPTMGGEDFSYFLQKVPGSFFWLGTAHGTAPEAPEAEPPLHSDRFDFNDGALVNGMVFMAGLALEFLA